MAPREPQPGSFLVTDSLRQTTDESELSLAPIKKDSLLSRLVNRPPVALDVEPIICDLQLPEDDFDDFKVEIGRCSHEICEFPSSTGLTGEARILVKISSNKKNKKQSKVWMRKEESRGFQVLGAQA